MSTTREIATPVHVDHLSVALGSIEEDVETAVAAGRTISSASSLRAAGFARQHRCAPDESALDLARRATEPIRERLGVIDAIIHAASLPLNANAGDPRRYAETRDVKHLMDFTASRLQAELGLDGAFVIGLDQQACTGFLGALRLARALIVAEPHVQRVLCVTADRFPEGALYEQSYNLISDGAAACVVSREPGTWEYLGGRQVTNGALAAASDDETIGSFFSFTHRVVTETLAAAGVTPADVAFVAPQNTNPKAWQVLARVLGIAPERIAMGTIASAGHLISGDNVANLVGLEATGRVATGDLVLLPMAGYGMNWQCALLRKRA